MVSGKAAMVDIGGKPEVIRIARAIGHIRLKSETIDRVVEGRIEKGDVLTNAKLAAISAVKKTPDLIFLTHIIPITGADVFFAINEEKNVITVETEVRSVGKTGVEIEALTGVTVALLSIFDLCKQYEKNKRGEYPSTEISGIKVIRKTKKG